MQIVNSFGLKTRCLSDNVVQTEERDPRDRQEQTAIRTGVGIRMGTKTRTWDISGSWEENGAKDERWKEGRVEREPGNLQGNYRDGVKDARDEVIPTGKRQPQTLDPTTQRDRNVMGLTRLLSGGRGTSCCSSTALRVYSGRTACVKRARPPFVLP